jgi:endonuclease/exonuclease/phosphatase (EEP) superfamily protein YafD
MGVARGSGAVAGMASDAGERFNGAKRIPHAFRNRRATFDHLGMQLDWIFLRKLGASKADIIPIEFSDHHALVAVLGPADQ